MPEEQALSRELAALPPYESLSYKHSGNFIYVLWGNAKVTMFFFNLLRFKLNIKKNQAV